MADEQARTSTPQRWQLTPGIKWLAIAEFVVGIGALAALGETNPFYYLLIVGVALVVVALVASDQRRRAHGEQQAIARRAAVRAAALALLFDGGDVAPQPVSASVPAALGSQGHVVGLASEHEVFVASLVEYGTRTGVRTITRADGDGWARARRVEYDLLRAASCCAVDERLVVGELITWDSVSVLHVLDTPVGLGDGVARSIVAPYGRLPAATRVPVRRDPARASCEVATLALDPRVANEFALNLLWRGIYDHARRGGATDVVWTLAADLAALLRDQFGFPIQMLGDNRRSLAGAAVTIVIPLLELEQTLLRDRPAYYGWLTVGFTENERAALTLPIDLSGAYDRVCAHVLAKLEQVRSPLVLQ